VSEYFFHTLRSFSGLDRVDFMIIDPSLITPSNCFVEIDTKALSHNTAVFRKLAGPKRKLAAVVKSDAYGHGMIEVSKIVLKAGMDWLAVFSVEEGFALRNAGIDAPILVLGPPSPGKIAEAVKADLRLTAASLDIARMVVKECNGMGAKVHLKIETGTNRQGLRPKDLLEAASLLKNSGIEIDGAYTHFADIEDTTDHTFAESQLNTFMSRIESLGGDGFRPPILHTACSAATILFPDTYFEMVRAGIALYGLWPSSETRVSAKMLGRNDMDLRPVMSVKTRITQINVVDAGQYVGYGRSFRTTRPSRLAVVPVGYADGYDRALSNQAHVLVRGVRAPIRGRICMNLMMIDVTDIQEASTGDEVVLLGRQGKEEITAEFLAKLASSINYEIVTRIAPGAKRVTI
jgi:alanine racemase